MAQKSVFGARQFKKGLTMKKQLVCGLGCLIISCSSFTTAFSLEPQNEEEALFIRRIADFWQEGEYQIVKNQIEQFLNEFPDSSLIQNLSATLGDLYLQEKNYQSALFQYTKVTDAELAQHIFVNRMQCLYHLQWFATLADECEAFLKNETAAQQLQVTYFLAISLYHQCLNASNDPNIQLNLAKRAEPYFQTLLQNDLSLEAGEAFAYLSSILKDYASAAEIYLRLAQQNDQNREEMLFHAALYQAEFDKERAMKTFSDICSLNQKRCGDALYNRLVLNYDIGQYEEILQKKDELLTQIAGEKQETAHLFFGRSHLQLKQYPEALKELLSFITTAEHSDILQSALIDVLNTAYQLNDIENVKMALARLANEFPNCDELAQGLLFQALLLKNAQQWNEAHQTLEDLCNRHPHSKEAELAIFEEIQIEYEQNRLEECSLHCRYLIENHAKSPNIPATWRYLISSVANLSSQSPDLKIKQNLIEDLKTMLSQNTTLSEEEVADYQFLMAKTYYETAQHDLAIRLLEALTKVEQDSTQKANRLLLLALCYRDQNNDLQTFCKIAEEALIMKADLMETASIHIALFNAYLSLNHELEKAAQHLFSASQLTDIPLEHLQWLSDFYYQKCKTSLSKDISPAIQATEKLFATAHMDIQNIDENSIAFECSIVNFAELKGMQNETDEQISLLKRIKTIQEEHSDLSWKESSRIDLLLASAYAAKGQIEEAKQLFDQVIANNPTLRTPTSALAALERSRLTIAQIKRENLALDHPDALQAISLLKTLMLQKNLSTEPIHLEAAIEYADLLTRHQVGEKRLSLLLKIKSDFEKTDDLLSSDYQNSRKHLPEKNRIYASYMDLIDAEIMICKTSLLKDESEAVQEKETAKKTFHQMLDQPLTAFISIKAREYLEQLNGQ